MATVRFVSFAGISPGSKAIAFFTRSKHGTSHIAYMRDDNSLIEVYGKPLVWKDSSLAEHTPGTRYQVWELEVTARQKELLDCYYAALARHRTPYNLIGVVAFVFLVVRSSIGKFCSQGIWDGCREAGLDTADVEGYRANPDTCVAFLRLLGALLVMEGTV